MKGVSLTKRLFAFNAIELREELQNELFAF